MPKKKKHEFTKSQKERVTIKFVRAANCWCRTTFTGNGQQVQQWSSSKPAD